LSVTNGQNPLEKINAVSSELETCKTGTRIGKMRNAKMFEIRFPFPFVYTFTATRPFIRRVQVVCSAAVLNNLAASSISEKLTTYKIEKNEMGWACGTYG